VLDDIAFLTFLLMEAIAPIPRRASSLNGLIGGVISSGVVFVAEPIREPGRPN
jgi:hypothetical protein